MTRKRICIAILSGLLLSGFALAGVQPVEIGIDPTVARDDAANQNQGTHGIGRNPSQIELEPVSDAFVTNRYPAWNTGGLDYLRVGTDKSGFEYAGYLSFAIEYLPADCQIVSAWLELYCHDWTGRIGGQVRVSRVTGSWGEYDISFKNAPSYEIGGHPAAPVHQAGWYSWDVTRIVRGWLESWHPNYGFCLFVLEDITSDAVFVARHGWMPLESPRLRIVYRSATCPASDKPEPRHPRRAWDDEPRSGSDVPPPFKLAHPPYSLGQPGGVQDGSDQPGGNDMPPPFKLAHPPYSLGQPGGVQDGSDQPGGNDMPPPFKLAHPPFSVSECEVALDGSDQPGGNDMPPPFKLAHPPYSLGQPGGVQDGSDQPGGNDMPPELGVARPFGDRPARIAEDNEPEPADPDPRLPKTVLSKEGGSSDPRLPKTGLPNEGDRPDRRRERRAWDDERRPGGTDRPPEYPQTTDRRADGCQSGVDKNLFVVFGDPSPFRTQTTLHYSVPSRQPVRAEIYSAHGSLVRTLVACIQDPGRHQVIWDGRDGSGRIVGPGTYIYRISLSEGVTAQKIVKAD